MTLLHYICILRDHEHCTIQTIVFTFEVATTSFFVYKIIPATVLLTNRTFKLII